MKNGYVFDPDDPTELARLLTLDRAITRSMGGPLLGISDDFVMRNVLDLACGPGGWVLDVAFPRPDVEVAGVDISRPMVDYANARAQSQGLTNATFGEMDITQPLDFGDGAFDLVNARYLVGVLKRWQWSALLAECFRLVRPGGIVRLVESDGLVISSSPSFTRLQHQLLSSMGKAGYGFSIDKYTLGITHVLPRLVTTAGFQSPELIPFVFDMSQDSPYMMDGLHMAEIAYEQAKVRHLLDGIADAGESIDELIQRMLIEMQEESFGSLNYGLTVCAVKPA